MKQLIPMDEHGMFADYNDTALVDSRFVADAFEKGHREVLRSIDQILSEDSGYSAEFNRCNFAPITYTDVRGRKQRKRQLEWYAINNAGKFGTTRESVALLTEGGMDA